MPNGQLIKEKHVLASVYGRSIAELNSFDLAWNLLMEPEHEVLRRAIYSTEEEFRHFRQLMVNIILATDIMDKDLGSLRKARWNKAFAKGNNSETVPSTPNPSGDEDLNRKATIVLEHLVQASDVAHTSTSSLDDHVVCLFVFVLLTCWCPFCQCNIGKYT